MPYQALYRQWRPRTFSQMVGQEAIVETLKNQVRVGRIAHAYLFCGSRGTGKTSTAKILARAINCEHPHDGDPCGECPACRNQASDESLDVIEIDAASNRGIDDARNLRETVKYPPQFLRYKVYIIDEVHMLTNEASNALLKTLEEPPSHTVFILATTEPQKLPSTILSRCQRFDFGRIPAQKIRQRLREAVEGENAEATDGALMMLARAAEGGMRDALGLLDICISRGKTVDEETVQAVLGTCDREFLFRFSKAIADENAAETIRMIQQLMKDGKDPQAFSRSFSDHIRTLITARLCGEETAEILDLTRESALEYISAAREMPISRMMDILDRFVQLESGLRYSASPRIVLENTCLKCCIRTKEPDTLALQERLAELENQIQAFREILQKGSVWNSSSAASEKEPSAVYASERRESKPEQAEKQSLKKKTDHTTTRSAEAVWKDALGQLKKSAPSINGMLAMGQYLDSDGTIYRWKCASGFGAIVQSLNSPDRKKQIEKALTVAAGIPCIFQALDDSEEVQDLETSDTAYLQELYQTFGAEPVSVVDHIPDER